MDHRIPEPVRPTLQDYVSRVNDQVPGLMKAFFIEGSIALGGFNTCFSDIDFVAILDHPATPMEFKALRGIHRAIEKRCPRWKLMGSYLQSADLDGFDREIEPHPTYHGGVLRPHGHFELDSVEGWILKNHGIALFGPEPQDLPFTVDWDLLIKKMRENLNTYWASWTRRPGRIIRMLSDWGIQWAVLGVLRQFYSFRENTITTKTKAGEYALTCVPARWHGLIREAIDIREGNKSTAYRLRVARAIEAVSFLKYIIQTCNASFAQASPGPS
jgi:hypothetical protein